ncbi:hypothetical protein N6H18_13770 [Reichenbachiella agarivorans]|uniref:Uncharacterized protein n=1 Tax=Reichenbachiella agarivorans TaxID=2979464 RepID=A0ABY6CLM4_9BACT|nr:hypothetical protein [Reichenbachiella agarivorans]UXP31419.1 hypothetical protein N6H18_13770 [Reichenbachiella agarivorans]
MKNVILLMFSLTLLTFVWSCTEEGFDDALINSSLDSLTQRLDSLENANQGILDSLNNVNTALLDSLAGVAHSVDSLGGVSQYLLDSIKALDGYAGPIFMTVTGTYDDGDTSFDYTKSKAFSIIPYTLQSSMSVYRYEYQEDEQSPVEVYYEVRVFLVSGGMYGDYAGVSIDVQEDGTVTYIEVESESAFSSSELGRSYYLDFYGESYLDEETNELEGEVTINSFSFDMETLELSFDLEYNKSVEQEVEQEIPARVQVALYDYSPDNARFTFSDQLVWGGGEY